MHGNFGLPCSGFKALYNGAGVKNGLFHPLSIFGTTFEHWPNNRRDFYKKSLMPTLGKMGEEDFSHGLLGYCYAISCLQHLYNAFPM